MHRWLQAWQRRQLAPLLSLFTNDARYINVSLGLKASGKADLSRLFGRILHETDGEIAWDYMQSNERVFIIAWNRTCRKISMPNNAIHARSGQLITCRGVSILHPRFDLVENCEEYWSSYSRAT
ncbi:MAG: nuclear transport factor 2 family protein [Terracidiphilus sp.]